MNPMNTLSFLFELEKSGTIISLKDGKLVSRGKALTDAQKTVLSSMKEEVIHVLEWRNAAERFVALSDAGKHDEAIRVMAEANYPCYEDGVNNAGRQGWLRIGVRRGFDAG